MARAEKREWLAKSQNLAESKIRTGSACAGCGQG